jgi:hypothetical protein
MTVDEWRQSIMHIKPLGGELGAKFLGEYLRKDPLAPGSSETTKALGGAKYALPQFFGPECDLARHHSKYIPFY